MKIEENLFKFLRRISNKEGIMLGFRKYYYQMSLYLMEK